MPKPYFIARSGSVAVKIYREPRPNGSELLRVAWNEHGKRHRKGFTDERGAKSFAKQRADDLARLGSAVLTLSGSETRSYRQASDSAARFGETLDSAFGEWLEARKALAGKGTLRQAVTHYLRHQPTKDCPALPEAVRQFLAESTRLGRSERHVQDLTSRLERLCASFTCSIAELQAADVESWLWSLPGLGPRSRANYRTAIASLVRWCERREWLVPGAFRFHQLQRETEPVGEVGIFTPAELRTLLGTAQPRLRPFLLLGAFCGIRHAEIRRLRWDQVHFEGDRDFPHGWVEVKAAQSKNASRLRSRARRLIPMTANLSRQLGPFAFTPESPVCPFVKTDNQLAKLSRAAGVTWVPNGLRHSFGSYRLALVQNENQVAAEMGNSPAEVFRSYRRLVTPAAAREWFSVTIPTAP